MYQPLLKYLGINPIFLLARAIIFSDDMPSFSLFVNTSPGLRFSDSLSYLSLPLFKVLEAWLAVPSQVQRSLRPQKGQSSHNDVKVLSPHFTLLPRVSQGLCDE